MIFSQQSFLNLIAAVYVVYELYEEATIQVNYTAWINIHAANWGEYHVMHLSTGSDMVCSDLYFVQIERRYPWQCLRVNDKKNAQNEKNNIK